MITGEERARHTETSQILDHAQCRLTIRDGSIEVMLLSILVDAEAFESQVPAGPVVRLDGAGEEERRLHGEVGLAVLHDAQLEGDDAGHLDGAAEGDLAVALGEVQVADAELGALDVHGQVDLAAAAQVLDVAVAAVLGPAGDGASALAPDLVLDVARRAPGVDVLRLRRLGDDGVELVLADQLGFALVPGREHFGRRCAAHDTRVNEAWEAHVRDVAGGAEDAFEVPDGLGGVRVEVAEEAAAVVLVEDAGEAPRLVLERLHVLDLDDEHVTGLGGFDFQWAGQVMDSGQVDVFHVVGAVVITNLAASPVDALNLDNLAILDRAAGWH